jgi:hypothetical protein
VARRAGIAAVLAALAALGVVFSAAGSSVQAARGDFFVPTGRTVTGFGPFSEYPSSDVPALRRAFGAPDGADRRRGGECILRWRSRGITVSASTYGQPIRPCRRGYFIRARLTNRRWHTSKGVHPGSTRAAARRAALRKCTPSKCREHGYVLGVHRSDCAQGLFPGVIAEVRGKRVASLIVYTHGCE